MHQNTYIDLFAANQLSAHTARAYAQELRRFFQYADTTNQSTQLQH
ncbi:site-specific integrase, partial [Candidatus Pacearchaeota archaeon]|nr:site-specific integrase [Candidatus Pacearchaeota archaeon]